MKTAAVLLVWMSVAGVAQTGRQIGVVQKVDAAGRRMELKTDGGAAVRVEMQETTRYLRVAPGSQDLSGAARVRLEDVAEGDRVLVRGRAGSETGVYVADTVVVMTRADLEKKREAERADWEKRGVGGVVAAVDGGAREVTVRVGGKGGRTVVLAVPAGAKVRRYAAESIRFSDARAGRVEELQVGDQVKARGEMGADGGRFVVEEMVSGRFRDFAATVVAVDAERGVVQVNDLAAKARVEVRVLPATLVRRLPAEVVRLVEARIQGAADDGRALQARIEGLPALGLAGLQVGEAVVVSGMNGEEAGRVTAITVLAGVEGLVRPKEKGARGADIGSWNLDLNMGVGTP